MRTFKTPIQRTISNLSALRALATEIIVTPTRINYIVFEMDEDSPAKNTCEHTSVRSLWLKIEVETLTGKIHQLIEVNSLREPNGGYRMYYKRKGPILLEIESGEKIRIQEALPRFFISRPHTTPSQQLNRWIMTNVSEYMISDNSLLQLHKIKHTPQLFIADS